MAARIYYPDIGITDKGYLYLWDPQTNENPKRIYGDHLTFLPDNKPQRQCEALEDGKFVSIYDHKDICIFDTNKNIDCPEFIIEHPEWNISSEISRLFVLEDGILIFSHDDELTLVNLNKRTIESFKLDIIYNFNSKQ